MMYVHCMGARSIQISLDDVLLEEVDNHPEVKQGGRSAFIRQALRLYLRLGRKMMIDRAYVQAYGGEADALYDELGELMEAQKWMEE